ncbi:hypothetical protein AJ80_01912 [Polytolypa hystricis UAMH7299]|uniref:Magnesium transporter n=1 Tax=Polytolypa hystricis (strain UAMH7299) TaxID=1447883 RepID=A0A2B7YQX4_POLH7|nr:hypothetical protein AJ80_01912 [Polytolypa hystricis UAMH7299]
MVFPAAHLKPSSSAPSANLLRFLRSQSDNCSWQYFTPSFAHTHARQHQQQHQQQQLCPWRLFRPSKTSCRFAATECTPHLATLEASLLPFFGARSRNAKTLSPSSSSSPSSSARLSPSANDHGLEARNPNKQYLQRFSATTTKRSRRSFLRRLLGLQRSSRDSELRPNDLPGSAAPIEDGYEGNLFNVGRSLAQKATNEPRLRCTEFDELGNVTLVNGEFKKSELIAKYGLLPRDLRKIDSSLLPHILIRHSAILINLLHLRVLIKSDRVLVFDAYGSADTYTQSVFMYDLEGKLRQKEAGNRHTGALPYELRALEAVLLSVTGGLEGEFEGVREPVVRVLRALEEDIDRDKLRHLLIYSKRLGSFEQKARLVRDAIEDLLEADDDLTAMYLSERANGVERAEHDHQEVEMLLESYHKVCDEIVQASGNLVTNIRNTEEVIKAILDANRNSLMLLDLKFSIGTLGLAAGTLISSFYGMNLKNFIEESDLGFAGVSTTCFFLTGFVCAYGLLKLRKVQRVRMWGEGGGLSDHGLGSSWGAPRPMIGGRGNWRSDSVDPIWTGLAGKPRTERAKRGRSGSSTPTASSSSSATASSSASSAAAAVVATSNAAKKP